MLSLSVRSLSGHCVEGRESLQFGPTIAALRAQLEQHVPPFHEVRLFWGSQELLDETSVEVEVQEVTAKSSAKALTAVEGFFEKIRANFTDYEDRPCKNDERSPLMELSDVEIQSTLAALVVIDEMNDLTADQCERLLHVLSSLPDGLSGPDGSLCCWRYRAVVSLGEVFGRTCVNPTSRIQKLLVEMASGRILFETASVIALVEISKRCEDVREHSENLCRWARYWVENFLRDGDAESYMCGIIRVLGSFGNLTDQHLLERISRQLDVSLDRPELLKEAATAAALLQLRHDLSQEAAFGADAEDNNAAATRIMEPAANVDIQYPAREDTDLALEQALFQSEEEAVQQEQSELHEALLRSKCDIPHAPPCEDDSTCLDARLVLLSFTRFPKGFRDALLSSQLALRHMDQGVELEPDWARPALVLSPAVTEEVVSEARELWHVAVCVGDEDEVHEIRLGLCSKTRPRIKMRFLVPIGASLFDDASDWKRRIAVQHFRSTDCRDYPVVNGFLHATGMVTGSPKKRSRSLPPDIRSKMN